MNKRERMLAAVVGAMAVLFVVKYSADRIQSSFKVRDRDIATLMKQVREKKTTIAIGQDASQQMEAFEERALPTEPELASSLYRKWLLELISEAGLSEPNVNSLPGRPFGDVYTSFTFMVTGRGGLDRLTKLLFDFYSVDHLHRINILVAKPIPETKQLDLTFSIEALSLPNSINHAELTKIKANRLRLPSLEDYQRSIVERNFTSFPNKPPRVSVDARSTYYLGDSVSFSASAEDAEKDSVSYSLVGETPDGAMIDANNGRFSFRPEELGTYHVTVAATDSGLPAKTTEYGVEFQITERPPEPVQQEAPPPPGFNVAQYAFLTGITEVSGQPQMWIFVRTEGKLLRLNEGDTFQIGALKGVIKRISERRAEFETDDGVRHSMALGQTLNDARAIESGE